MDTLEAYFQVPDYITRGLQSGEYERVGGVVREHGTKHVVAWLREAAPEKLINFAPKLLSRCEAFAGVLNLGVSVCGFSLILNRLNKLEAKLKESQALLSQVNQKLDLSIYGNFVSAIKQANAAILMNSPENRRGSALQAIDRLLATQHHFTSMVDSEIERDTRNTENLLPSLSLAYVAEARCYLELEEVAMANSRLEEGVEILLPRYKQYVTRQLANPKALFLHSDCQKAITLPRLVSAYQWTNNGLTEGQARQIEEAKLAAVRPSSTVRTVGDIATGSVSMITDRNEHIVDRLTTGVAFAILSPVVWGYQNVKATTQNATRTEQMSLIPELPERFQQIETLIEDSNRFEGFGAEVKTMQKNGMSFSSWRDLKSHQPGPQNNEGIICIIRKG